MDTAEQQIREHLKHWLAKYPNELMPDMEVCFHKKLVRNLGAALTVEFLHLHIFGPAIGGRCYQCVQSVYTLDERSQIAPPPVGKKLKDRPAYYTAMAKRIFTKLKLGALPSLKLRQ